MAHERSMRRCLELARAALAQGDVLWVRSSRMETAFVAEGLECTQALRDPSAHAEVRAIQAACVPRDLAGRATETQAPGWSRSSRRPCDSGGQPT